MSKPHVAECLIDVIEWSKLHAKEQDGESTRDGLRELLAAETPEAAQGAYWKIENHAFVQGELFEVSEACASVLIAALADPRESFVRVAVLELMFQILGGYASEDSWTPKDIVQRCQRVMRDGLWLIVREALTGEREAALEVLEQLGEAERARSLLTSPRHLGRS